MEKCNKTLFNPFDYINVEKIRNNVNTLKDRHPDWEKEDICKELIKKKSRLCASSGALSALPSSIPGLGTFITIIGGTAVDIGAMVYFLSELTMEIAAVYNRDLSTEATVKESLWVLSSCFGVESKTVGISKVAVINASKRALAVLIDKLLTIIGGWLAKTILLRMLPIIGSVINAYINVSACKHVGKEVVLWYKTNLEQESAWSKTSQKQEEDFPEDDDVEEKEDIPVEDMPVEDMPVEDIPDENIILEPMNKEEEIEEEVVQIITPVEVLPPEKGREAEILKEDVVIPGEIIATSEILIEIPDRNEEVKDNTESSKEEIEIPKEEIPLPSEVILEEISELKEENKSEVNDEKYIKINKTFKKKKKY